MAITIHEIVDEPVAALVATVALLRDRLAAHTAMIGIDEQVGEDAEAFAAADLILACRFSGRLRVDLSGVPGATLVAVSSARYPQVVFDLDLRGPDGNIYAVIGRVCELMRGAGASTEEVGEFWNEANATSTYTDALACCGRWITMPERRP